MPTVLMSEAEYVWEDKKRGVRDRTNMQVEINLLKRRIEELEEEKAQLERDNEDLEDQKARLRESINDSTGT